MTSEATPGREELLAELIELVALSGDPNVSSSAIGIRVRNQRQLYADMKQFFRLATTSPDSESNGSSHDPT